MPEKVVHPFTLDVAIFMTTSPIKIAQEQIESGTYDLKKIFVALAHQKFSEQQCSEYLPMLTSTIRINKRLKRSLTVHKIAEDATGGVHAYFEYNPNLFPIYKKQKEQKGETFSASELVEIVSEGLRNHLLNSAINFNKVSRMHEENPELAAALVRS